MITTLKKKTKTIPTFLKKTYQILEDSENQSIIKWAPDGKGFKIFNQQSFSKVILPKYFKHSNYSSFVRQLNMYNFHKMRDSGTESFFYHECFNRNNSQAIYEIKRKPQRKKKKIDDENQQEKSYPEVQITKDYLHQKKLKSILKQNKNESICYSISKIKIKAESVINTQHSSEIKVYIQDQDDNISIQQCINQKIVERPLLGTKELICASTTNFYTSIYQNNSTSLYSIGSLIR